jgi:DNA-binding transcriptional MerR regulator
MDSGNSSNRGPNSDMPLNAVQALMMLRSEMTQRETRMSASFNEQVQSLRQEVSQFRHDVANIVNGAGAQIAHDAKATVSPVMADYSRAVSATSAHLQGASKTVWLWFGAAGSILLLVLIVGWAMLGYYRRELIAAKDELQRYENAVPVVQAFYASDAVLCGNLLCVNIDPNGPRQGDKKQYHQAMPRLLP